MKKLISGIMAACMGISMVACGSADTAASTAATTTDTKAAETTAAEPAATATGDTITLGLIGPMTGSLAVYGTHVANGVNLAVEQINESGGIEIGELPIS